MGKWSGLLSSSLSYTWGTNRFLQHSDMGAEGLGPKSTKLAEKLISFSRLCSEPGARRKYPLLLVLMRLKHGIATHSFCSLTFAHTLMDVGLKM